MRKRRAILYDDEPAILTLLTSFFEERGYDVIACAEPVACPVYDDADRCDKKRPCGDLMITDLEMPRMSGLELLALQARRGCKLPARNKAVLSGGLDPAAIAAIRDLGCAPIPKPCRLGVLAAWVADCEQRMDLSQPLGVRRREHRDTRPPGEIFKLERGEGLLTAEVVNRSDSGLCIRVDEPLAVAQVLNAHSRLPLPSDRLRVQWLRPDADGRYLAGISCC